MPGGKRGKVASGPPPASVPQQPPATRPPVPTGPGDAPAAPAAQPAKKQQPPQGQSKHVNPNQPMNNSPKGPGFLPPGADKMSKARKNCFGSSFEPHFVVPSRIQYAPMPLVEAVNDFHFAMMNDNPRNEFYYELLKKNVTPETGVLEIGAGSGLLSLMAAKLGAKWVVAVEGTEDMAELARRNVRSNGFEGRVTVLTMLSSDLELKHLPAKPDILVSEIFGTLLLGESAHDYIHDVRSRGILKPSTRVIPQKGIQYAVPIECKALDSICSVASWNGLDLSNVTALKDTCSCVFTKKFGFRMSSVEYKKLAKPIPVLEIDFKTTDPETLPRNQKFTCVAEETGIAHAMMLFWEASDEGLVMSTDPEKTRDNFPRDMQWGQALQLLEDGIGTSPLPQPLMFKKGEAYTVDCRASGDAVLVQFLVSAAQQPAVEKEPETKE